MRLILNLIWFVTFQPFGRDIVSIEEAERRGAPTPGRGAGLIW
jgi:uncharacterized membrane protein YccF (DUF307 family)